MDWRDNKTSVYCAKRLPNVSSEDMLNHIQKVIVAWQKQKVNGSIIVCEKDFVLYWKHSKFWDSSLSLSALFPFFAPVLEQPIISGKPLLRSVLPLSTLDYKGLSVESGSNLDVRLIEGNARKLPISKRLERQETELS